MQTHHAARRLAALLVALVPLAAGAELPATNPVESLPSIPGLPDPFLRADGSRLTSPAEWPAQRERLAEMVLRYEYGHMPPAPGNVVGRVLGSAPCTQPGLGANTEQAVLLTFGPGEKLSLHLTVTLPAGKGPWPVILKGDRTWGRVKPEIIEAVVTRGYALVEFDRTEIAPDSPDRTTGVYPLYPTYDWGSSAAWAWGIGRVVDYVLTRDDIDPHRVIVTGHSRGGKAALLAGALDERVAITAPNASGSGGAGCFRHQAPKSETLGNIVKRFPFWFQADFGRFIDHVDRLPFDQHEVKVLCAPRAMFSSESQGDLWANPEGTAMSFLAAREVYKFLGVPERIGIHYRQGKHDQNLEDVLALLDFADAQFKRDGAAAAGTKFDTIPFPDAAKPFTWAAP